MRVNALPIGHIPVLIDVRRGRLVSKTFDAWPAMDWRWIGQGPRDEWPIGADLAYMKEMNGQRLADRSGIVGLGMVWRIGQGLAIS